MAPWIVHHGIHGVSGRKTFPVAVGMPWREGLRTATVACADRFAVITEVAEVVATIETKAGGRPARVTECPFCGQPLRNEEAVRHLARRVAAQEAQMRDRVEAEAAKHVAATERRLKVEMEQQLARAQKQHETKVRDEVRARLAEATEKERTKLQQENAKREKEMQQTVKSLQTQNDQLTRRIERMQAGDRGEFNEDDIAARLQAAFPDDDVIRTGRGRSGADLAQTVRFRSDGRLIEAGRIVYECKDTLAWNNAFVAQAAAEARSLGTPYAVLVTRSFPAGARGFVLVDGVLIVEPARCVALAELVRHMAIEVFRAGLVGDGAARKTAELYDFISSAEFRQEFHTLSRSSAALEAALKRERDWHERNWAERQRLYQGIRATVTKVDTRFRCILEDGANTPTK